MTTATRAPGAANGLAADPPHATPRVPEPGPPQRDGVSVIRDALLAIAGGRQVHRRMARSAVLVLLRHALGGTYPWGRFLRAMPRFAGFTMPSKYDADIFHRIVVVDEYGVSHLPLRAPDVVVDIGAHIGSFTALCYQLGSRRIVACEASPRLFPVLQKNLRRLDGVETTRAAICRSDADNEGTATISGFGTANDTVLFGGRSFDFPAQRFRSGCDERVDHCPLLALDRILARFPRIRLLKLDCEGSEFPILLTSRLLDRVELIVGEYHETTTARYRSLAAYARLEGTDRYCIQSLADGLAAQGFGVTVYPVEPNIGFFSAWRTGAAPRGAVPERRCGGGMAQGGASKHLRRLRDA